MPPLVPICSREGDGRSKHHESHFVSRGETQGFVRHAVTGCAARTSRKKGTDSPPAGFFSASCTGDARAGWRSCCKAVGRAGARAPGTTKLCAGAVKRHSSAMPESRMVGCFLPFSLPHWDRRSRAAPRRPPHTAANARHRGSGIGHGPTVKVECSSPFF